MGNEKSISNGQVPQAENLDRASQEQSGEAVKVELKDLDAKGRASTLYPNNSPSCPGCGNVLPRVFVREFRPSLGRVVAWSVLDTQFTKTQDGRAFHVACHEVIK